MLFRDLVKCNKEWDVYTDLLIISTESLNANPRKLMVALDLFGDRQVVWFIDRVVVLL